MRCLFIVILASVIQYNSTSLSFLKINPKKDKDVSLSLKEIASSIKNIKLETNESCVLGWIRKILIDGNNVFISSHQGAITRLFSFSIEGKFLTEIGSTGRGPGEFSTALDFSLDTESKKIYILDTMGKIFVYDYSGKFLKSINLDTKPTGVIYNKESLFLYSAWPDYHLNKGFGLQVKSFQGNVSNKYMLNRRSITPPKIKGIMVDHNYFMGLIKNKICLIDSKFDTLYYVTSDHTILPFLVIDLVDKMPQNVFTYNDVITARKTHNSAFNFIITERYLFFSVISPDQITYFYKYILGSKILSKHTVTKDKNYFLNDFDGGVTFKPDGVAAENVLYSTVDCDVIKEHLSKNFQKMQSRNSSLASELKSLVEISNFSDNPILTLVFLK